MWATPQGRTTLGQRRIAAGPIKEVDADDGWSTKMTRILDKVTGVILRNVAGETLAKEYLRGAALQEVELTNALHDVEPQWPKGFEPWS